jgi:hypothetical protein
MFIPVTILLSFFCKLDFDFDFVAQAYAEIALTGTALPVLLDISPRTKFDFGECPVGEHVDILCTIRNDSTIHPAIFEFRRIAQFSVRPPNGKISPGQTQDVIFSFAPKQVGELPIRLGLSLFLVYLVYVTISGP